MSGDSASEPAAVQFSAGDAIASGGQVVQIPIRVRIQGDYPLRVLMLGLTVQPLDGSPAWRKPCSSARWRLWGNPQLPRARGSMGMLPRVERQIGGLTGERWSGR